VVEYAQELYFCGDCDRETMKLVNLDKDKLADGVKCRYCGSLNTHFDEAYASDSEGNILE